MTNAAIVGTLALDIEWCQLTVSHFPLLHEQHYVGPFSTSEALPVRVTATITYFAQFFLYVF